MHDEATARRLWCPMVAHYNAAAMLVKITAKDNDRVRLSNFCCAFDCALWVWDEDEHGVCKQSGTGEPMRGRCGLIRR